MHSAAHFNRNSPRRPLPGAKAYCGMAKWPRLRGFVMSILSPLVASRHRHSPAAPAARDLLERWLPEIRGNHPEALFRLAAGPPRRLGEMVTDFHEWHANAVDEAFTESARTGERIGEVLVRKGTIATAERDALLEFQRRQRGEAPTDARLRLGSLLIAGGHISESLLDAVLAAQRRSGRKLGEELVAGGHVTHEVLERTLALQARLVGATIAAAMAMANPGIIEPAEAAQAASQTVRFAIKVLPMVRLEVLRQPQAIEVTAQDIARGYVEVDRASLVQVQSNTTWEVSFQPRTDIFRRATVRGLAGDVHVGPEGGSRPALMATRLPSAYELSYRFDLSPGVMPGSYPWPLAVSAHAI